MQKSIVSYSTTKGISCDFSMEIDWILQQKRIASFFLQQKCIVDDFFNRNALKEILQKKCIASYSTTEMNFLWFYKRNIFQVILLQKFISNDFSIEIH